MIRHFLYLQGPLSPFYADLSAEIAKEPVVQSRIVLNGGDKAFPFNGGTVDYTGRLSQWREYVQEFMVSKMVTDLVLYGDCRKYHRIAVTVARINGIRVWVFEEGYLRPDFITFERNGVNGYSEFENDGRVDEFKGRTVQHPKNLMLTRAAYAARYYFNRTLRLIKFRHYEHHRKGGTLYEGWSWMLSMVRKPLYKVRDALQWAWVKSKGQTHNIYIVPLQVHNDSQIHVHSDYESVEEFLKEVIYSFCLDAPDNSILVVKHHPMDRGFCNYSKVIRRASEFLRPGCKIVYGHEFRLPEMYKYAAGCITVNSTVGISALINAVPVKAMGTAIYNIEGLTNQDSLHQFWSSPGSVNTKIRKEFLNRLKVRTQLKGFFYSRDEALVSELAQRLMD